jgi:hypothetical protein
LLRFDDGSLVVTVHRRRSIRRLFGTERQKDLLT